MRFPLFFFLSPFVRLTLCRPYRSAEHGNMKDEQNTVAKRVELKEHGKAINFYIFSVIHLFLFFHPLRPTTEPEKDFPNFHSRSLLASSHTLRLV